MPYPPQVGLTALLAGEPLQAWYLSYFSGLVFLSPYQNLFFKHVGLRDSQIGLLALLRTWTTAPASFFWSGTADRYRAHR
jgi:hypothetical protein